jgi:hypothetical protein
VVWQSSDVEFVRAVDHNVRDGHSAKQIVVCRRWYLSKCKD